MSPNDPNDPNDPKNVRKKTDVPSAILPFSTHFGPFHFEDTVE
jgi:hypothetical protein